MSYNPEQTVAKRVYLHRNGQPQQPPKMLVVNQRQIRDFNSFLSQATGGLKTSVAVRSIYTPISGTRVHSLEQLEPGRHYVAGGNEKFRKGKYEGQPEVLLPKRKPYLQQFHVPLRTQQAVVASARYRKPTEKPITIHVFRNGDENFGGVKVLLGKRSLLTMDKAMEIVTDKADLFTPAKRMFTVDGQMVQSLEELVDKEAYVAVEGSKVFRKVAYTRNETFNKSPTRRITVPRIKRLKSLPMAEGRAVSDAAPTQEEQDGQPSPRKQINRHLRPKPPAGQRVVKPGGKKFSRKERPMGGRKDKEARELALRDQQEDSVFGGSPVLGHAILPMPSPPGSGLKPSPPGSGLKPSPPGSGLKPSPPGSGLKPSPPGSGLKPTESVDTADNGQTEEVATAHGNHAEVPEEDEVGEEGRAVHDQQELVVGLQPQVEQEDEIPEEGDDVPLEKLSQEERLAAGGSMVPREEDDIEEQVEEEQPTSYSAGLTEFQSQTAKQTVDLSVHRKQSDGDSGQQGKMTMEEAAIVESKLPSPPPPHEENGQSQRASNLSNASKSSMRSMSEGNLKEPSKSSLRTDLKNGLNSSVKDNLKDASKSSLKSSLKDDSKVSMKSDASKASSGSHVSASSRKFKGAASTSSKTSVKSGVVQETASRAGSVHASGEEGKSDPLPRTTASHNSSVEERGTRDEGGSSERVSEKAEVSKTTGLAEDSRVDGEEGSTEEQLPKGEGEVAVSNRLHEGEAPETDDQDTLNGSSIQGTGAEVGATQPVERQPQESRRDQVLPPDTRTMNSRTQSQAQKTFVKPTQTKRRMFIRTPSPPSHSAQC